MSLCSSDRGVSAEFSASHSGPSTGRRDAYPVHPNFGEVAQVYANRVGWCVAVLSG